MTCSRCTREIEDDSAYCRFCGKSAAPDPVRRLRRLPLEGKAGGVCAGLAAHLNADPTLIRLAWAVLTVVPGMLIGGIVVYVAAWVLMPVNELGRSPYHGKRLMRPDGDSWIAGVCGGIAERMGIDSTIVRVVAVILAVYPGYVVFGIITYAVLWAIIPPAPLIPMHTAPTRI
jgi:phage shock protein PspC (stress-responsive transcriptional regulator)